MKDERGIVSNIDAFAQWTQTDFNINILLPELQEPLKVTTNPSSIGKGESCDIFLSWSKGDNGLNVTGNLKQVVHTGNAMSEVVLTPKDYRRCFPISWIKNETRPSGIVMTGDTDNGGSLTFNGSPTKDDTIQIPYLIDKFKASLNIQCQAHLDTNIGDQHMWFLNKWSMNVIANELHNFANNVTIDSLTFTPESMKKFFTVSVDSAKKILTITLKPKAELVYSEMSDVSITIPNSVVVKSTYRVSVSLGSNITSSGGALTQDVVIGQSMTQINLTASNGMSFFPSNHNQSKDGISVNVDTSKTPYTSAWISGTPLRDVSLPISATVKGTSLTVNLPSDKTVIAKAGTESKLRQFVKSGAQIDRVNLVVADSNNYKLGEEWKKGVIYSPTMTMEQTLISETAFDIGGVISDNTTVIIPSALRKVTQFVKVVLGTNLTLAEGSTNNEANPNEIIRIRVRPANGYYFPNGYIPSSSGDISGQTSNGVTSLNGSEIIYQVQSSSCNLTINFPAPTAIPKDGLFLTIGQSGSRYGWDTQVSPIYGDLRMPMIYSWPAICIWCDKLSNGNYRIEMRASGSPVSSANRIAISFYLHGESGPSTASYFKNFKVENGIGIWWTEENTDRLGNIYKYFQNRLGKIVEVLLADYDMQAIQGGGYYRY